MDGIERIERVGIGATVEGAVASALEKLGLTEEEVDIKVIEPGSKGLFGVIGSKPAKVSVSKKITPEESVEHFLREVFAAMGLAIKLEVSRREKHLHVNFTGQNLGLLIGKRGQTLDSLQYLTNLVVNRSGVPQFSVVLDAENYRKRRKDTLEALAVSLARKVKSTKKNVVLEPMSRYERHVIHTILQRDSQIKTYSEGVDPHRHVVVALK